MTPIQRIGVTRRWSEVVIHRGVASWVEVADDMTADVRSQIEQVFSQIDATLTRLGGDRTRVLQVLIYLADLTDAPILNEQWDAWFPLGHAPVRACVQAGLGKECRVEMVLTVACDSGDVA